MKDSLLPSPKPIRGAVIAFMGERYTRSRQNAAVS